MNQPFSLEKYLENGIEALIGQALRASLQNPAESLFLARFVRTSRKANQKRAAYMEHGEHIPPFLIASITTACNLRCAGCYDRCNQEKTAVRADCQSESMQLPDRSSRHAQDNHEDLAKMLSADDWRRIFDEARNLGILFVLLAGGEPLLRPDIIRLAAKYPEILFPVFSNGTLIDQSYQRLFARNRNLLPIISLEGDRVFTDARRGQGVYARLECVMRELSTKKIFYGVSITVTTENLALVSCEAFVHGLRNMGCKLIFYIEYVPIDSERAAIAPGEAERIDLEERLALLRETYRDMLFVSFPGDEKASGGCLAAGRGFFHIRSNGSAEPCPFSPYSDTSLRQVSLREALQSPLFLRLRSNEILLQEHAGGCVLFDRDAWVRSLLHELTEI